MRSFLELVPALATAADAVGSVGGLAHLPPGTEVPHCTLCDAKQTFFLQLAFPREHAWAGVSVAVFACTRCVRGDLLIPEMLSGRLPQAHVPADFLRRYQRNFRILVFRTHAAQPHSVSESAIVSGTLQIASAPSDNTIGLIGGSPRWVLGDESPALVAGSAAVFLFQLFGGLRFQIVPTAPPQRTLALDGTPEDSADNFYELFIGNDTYFFGGAPADDVYVLTQVD